MGLLKKQKEPSIEFKILNNEYFKYRFKFMQSFNKKIAKAFVKDSHPLISKGYKQSAFLIRFKGDVVISNIQIFREKITALLNIANQGDTCIFAIESGGGTVTAYGELSYELSRIRKAGVKLITTVDQIAASGGYMLAVQGDKVYASPNAVLGSIGVIVSMPNYEELLGKVGVKYYDYMAGKNKRPITPYNEPTQEGIENLNKDLKKVHDMFKNVVQERRPNIDIDKVSEGDTYFGQEALDLNMIDGFATTNEIVYELINNEHLVTEITYYQPEKKRIINRFIKAVADEVAFRINDYVSNSKKI